MSPLRSRLRACPAAWTASLCPGRVRLSQGRGSRGGSLGPWAPGLLGVLLLAVAVAGSPARGQSDLEEVFGDLGSAAALGDEADAAQGQREGEGTIRGRVFDGDLGTPISGVTVIAAWEDAAGDPRQEVQVSDADGGFEFPSLPPGSYSLSFVKAGFRASAMKNFEVRADEVNRADFPMPPLPAQASEDVLELEEFVVEAATVSEMMTSLELRMESDQLLNILSAEDLSKFAASDVADALKRVAGVNVVEGQFAIIRGLEDRYSSTTYNGAPIPSPDPTRQSVQLDLFPSDVVSNLVVEKTFGASSPGNSSGGSIDIVTHDYPEETLRLKLNGGGGFEEGADDRFLEFQSGSPVGRGADDIWESDFGGSVGGRTQLFGRELRYKGLFARETDFRTRDGFQEGREPIRPNISREGDARRERIRTPGGLATGELFLSDGLFDLTESERAYQKTEHIGFGFDIDREGNHRIDASHFRTRKEEETVQLKENGYLPNVDYDALVAAAAAGEDITDEDFFGGANGDFATSSTWIAQIRDGGGPSRGPNWNNAFFETKSLDIDRELKVQQLNGEHRFDLLPGLELSWAANTAETTQEEEALGARVFASAANEGFPRVALSPGLFNTNAGGLIDSANQIAETQDFARMDAEYEFEIGDWLSLQLTGGGWYERSDRDVESTFLESATLNGDSQFAVQAPTLEELGDTIFSTVSGFRRRSTNESSRDIDALSLGMKATFWDKFDVLAGVRREEILIESNNDPFTGRPSLNTGPQAFPSLFLFLDRLDNPALGEVDQQRPQTYNDQLLGIGVPSGPCRGTNGEPDPRFASLSCVDLLSEDEARGLLNGVIDETKYLPSLGLSYRPIEGLSLRAAYSQTVARPSFRELGFYASVELGSDDLIVGNPRLGLSEVESYDFRVEYTWGDLGDLFALSLFKKEIDNPIETLVIRDPTDLRSGIDYQTFFNNPDTADLWGIEVEGRKHFGFLGSEFMEYFSIGGNFTWIDAEVDRNPLELDRASVFFRTPEGTVASYNRLEESRRLFGQPEWIANADLSFDHPGWGTRATLSLFAISDVLDAAGNAGIEAGTGRSTSYTLDRYTAEFHQVDLVLSQTLDFGFRPDFGLLPDEAAPSGVWTAKFSVKNLTDSTRGIIYDTEQTSGEVSEREFKIGRDYSFSLSYSLTF